jgi:hypothetical protein
MELQHLVAKVLERVSLTFMIHKDVQSMKGTKK